MIHDKKRVNALQAAAKAGIEALEELRNKTTLRSKRPFVPDRTLPVSDPDVSSTHPSAWLFLLLGLHSRSGPAQHPEDSPSGFSIRIVAGFYSLFAG